MIQTSGKSYKNLGHRIGVERGWQFVDTEPWKWLVSLPPKDLERHALLLGSTGCGKSTLIHHLMAQDILYGHSFVLLDLRGDLVSAVLELCAGRVPAKNVRIIDLREKDRIFGFNPLSGSGESYIRALGILSALEESAASWGVQLAETLRSALILLAEAGHPITEIEQIFYDPLFRKACLDQCQTDSLRGFWNRYGAKKPDHQESLAMPVLNKLSLLLSTRTLRAILGHPNPIDLGRHLNQPGSILLVSLAVDELHGAARLMGNIILSSICREIFARVPIPEQERNPVRLYVDEFENFAIPEFESVLAEGRRFRLSTILAHQTLAQLSHRMRSIVLNNVGAKLLFRCGREDARALSADISGDPKRWPLTELPTGSAVLWRNGKEPLTVEINDPIVDSRRQSESAKQYLSEIYNTVRQDYSQNRRTELPQIGQPPSIDLQPVHMEEVYPSPLSEDWL